MTIRIKRVYEPPAENDGYRVLVERLWPRGLTKQRAKVDLWLKDIAPSTPLRQWFGHDPVKWNEFCTRYTRELSDNTAAVQLLCTKLKQGPITLVYAARDEQHNSATVLLTYLQSSLGLL